MKRAPAPEEAKRQTRFKYSIGQSDQNTVNRKHDEAAGGYASLLDSIRTALLEAGIEPANPDALLSRLAEAEGKQRGASRMERTDAAHMDHLGGERRTRDDVQARPDALNTLDGNGVDLDQEVARFAENKARYEATVESSRRRFAIMSYVISSMQTG